MNNNGSLWDQGGDFRARAPLYLRGAPLWFLPGAASPGFADFLPEKVSPLAQPRLDFVGTAWGVETCADTVSCSSAHPLQGPPPTVNPCFLTWGSSALPGSHLRQVLRTEGSRQVQVGKEVTETRFFPPAVQSAGLTNSNVGLERGTQWVSGQPAALSGHTGTFLGSRSSCPEWASLSAPQRP